MSLLLSVKEVFTDTFINNIADLLGESKKETATSVEAFLPALLGGIAFKGSNAKGVKIILNILRTNNIDNKSITISDKFIDEQKISKQIKTGEEILESIFGSKQNDLLDLLSKNSRLSNPAKAKLLSFLTPIVFKKIEEDITINNLDTLGIKNYFLGKKNELTVLYPELEKIFTKRKSEIKVHSIKDFEKEVEKPKKKWIRLFFPLIAVLFILWILTKFV